MRVLNAVGTTEPFGSPRTRYRLSQLDFPV
jgi:hypothetical protein